MRRIALTAIGRDKPGIVAGVAKVLFENGCNIEDSSMTGLEDEFSIILIMSAPDDISPASLKKGLKVLEERMGLTIHLKEIEKEKAAGARPSTHMVTVSGYDRPGIVYRTAAMLAELGINITDLSTKAFCGEEKNIYIMLMEVSVPENIDGKKVEASLKTLGEGLGVKIEIKPIESYEAL